MLHCVQIIHIYNSHKLETTQLSLLEEWIQIIWYICIMEFYSAIKNNDFMIFIGKWKEFENIILSEVIQSQKNTYCKYSLMSGY